MKQIKQIKNNLFYIGLSKNINLVEINKHLLLQKNIIEYFKCKLDLSVSKNIKIILSKKKHIIESNLIDIDVNNSIVFWHPIVAYNNMVLVNKYKNSVVFIDKPTLLNQKISEYNPITEEVAINNNFKLIYLNNIDDDITNINYTVLGFNNESIFDFTKLIN